MELASRGFLVVAMLFIALIALVLVGFLYTTHPPRYFSSLTPAALGWAYEPVTFSASDGVTLRGWYVPRAGELVGHPFDASSAGPVIVVLHGYPFSKAHMLPVSEFLHREFHLFLLDLRYFGESDGSETTLGAREWRDVLAAIHHLRERGAPAVGVWGISLGAAVALLALPHTRDVQAVVVDTPYTDLGSMAMDYYRFLPGVNRLLAWCTDGLARLTFGVSLLDVSPLQAAVSSQVPMLLIHGGSDSTIPVSHFHRFQEALQTNPTAEFWLVEGAGHGSTYATERDWYERKVTDFFRQRLG